MPEPPQRDVEQRVGAAVERRAGHDVLAGLRELGEQQRLGRLPAAGRDGADPALEAGHALLERGDRRVAEARVDVPVLLQREQVGGVLDVLEHERGRLVDRHRPRAGGRVGPPAGVDRARALAPGAVLDRRHAGEGSKLTRPRRSARSAPARGRGRRAAAASRRSRRTRSGRTRRRAAAASGGGLASSSASTRRRCPARVSVTATSTPAASHSASSSRVEQVLLRAHGQHEPRVEVRALGEPVAQHRAQRDQPGAARHEQQRAAVVDVPGERPAARAADLEAVAGPRLGRRATARPRRRASRPTVSSSRGSSGHDASEYGRCVA